MILFDSDVDMDVEWVDKEILTGLNKRLCIVDEDVDEFEFDRIENAKFDCVLDEFWVAWSFL